MDSDSDVPLSNYAGIYYFREEIARLERLVAKKTARVRPSASSPAAAERRSVSRILTAGTVYSSAAATSSSAVEQREVRSLERCSSSNREGASVVPQTDARERSSAGSDATARKLETRSSSRDRENDGRLREGDRPEPQRFEDRGTPRSARNTKPGYDPSSSDHSE